MSTLPAHPNARGAPVPPPAAVPAAAPPATSRTEEWRSQLRAASKMPIRAIQVAKKILELDELDTELNRSATYRRSIMTKTLHDAAHVLYHLDPKDMEAMIEGDFKKLKKSKTLPEQIEEPLTGDPTHNENRLRKKDRLPVIYQHYHVDPNGDAPTLEQYYQVAQLCMMYLDVMKCKHNKQPLNPRYLGHVESVDQMVPAPSVKKAPRVTYTGPYPRSGHSESSQKALDQWIQCILSIRHYTPAADRKKPLKHALSETGWTIDYLDRRFAHHEHGERSNKLMNIVDAATRRLYPNSGFRWEWIIVLEVVTPHLVTPAEQVISRLSMSYTTCGGTNQELGGLSTATGDKSLANIAYRETSDLITKKMHERMTEDMKALDRALKRIRQAKDTEAACHELENKEEKLKEKKERIKELEKKLDEEMESLKQAAPEWFKRVHKQNQALVGLDGMKEVSEAMKELLSVMGEQ